MQAGTMRGLVVFDQVGNWPSVTQEAIPPMPLCFPRLIEPANLPSFDLGALSPLISASI